MFDVSNQFYLGCYGTSEGPCCSVMAVEEEMKRTRVRKLERRKKDGKEQMTWPPSQLNFIPLKWNGSGRGRG